MIVSRLSLLICLLFVSSFVTVFVILVDDHEKAQENVCRKWSNSIVTSIQMQIKFNAFAVAFKCVGIELWTQRKKRLQQRQKYSSQNLIHLVTCVSHLIRWNIFSLSFSPSHNLCVCVDSARSFDGLFVRMSDDQFESEMNLWLALQHFYSFSLVSFYFELTKFKFEMVGFIGTSQTHGHTQLKNHSANAFHLNKLQ